MRRTLVVLLLGGLLLPLLPLILTAVSVGWRYPALVPDTLTGRGLTLLADPSSDVLRGLLTSLGIGAAVTVIACAVGIPAGRALGLYSFRGRRLVLFALLAPAIVPGLAATMGIQILLIRYGLAQSVPGVVVVQLVPTIPYVATVLAGAFANLGPDYERQAQLLGAGPLRRLVSVTLPMLRPSLAVAALFAFLISWSEYILTLLVGGGQVKTLPIVLFATIGSADTTAAAAVGLLVVVPPMLAVAASARVLRSGSAATIGLGRL